MDIVIAATRHGAEAYGLADSLGTVAPGQLADLLLLEADPLVTVANLRRIREVIQGGRVVDRAALPTVRVLQSDPSAPWPR
jgi:imidazolonepropionase-like amidohydrolase